MANKHLIIDSNIDKDTKVKGLIACIASEIEAAYNEILSPFKLSQTQLRILHVLSESEQSYMTVNEIKANMFDKNPNVSRSLNYLVDKGLISKVRDGNDQRVVKIMINKAGIDLHHQADKEFYKRNQKLPLSSEEVNTLYELLKKI